VKIAIPVQEVRGLESPVYGHFGSAPGFLLVDTATRSSSAVDNQRLAHEHGHCNPIAALAGEAVEAVVTGGIGGRALQMFNSAGIRVFRAAAAATAADVLKRFDEGSLEEITSSDCCSGAHGHGCHN